MPETLTPPRVRLERVGAPDHGAAAWSQFLRRIAQMRAERLAAQPICPHEVAVQAAASAATPAQPEAQ